MNRRKFFGAIAAAVTAACVPGGRVVDLSHVKMSFPSILDRKGPGHMLRYGSGARAFIETHTERVRFNEAMQWWRPNATHQVNFAEIEARTLASLQDMWKECRAYKTGDTLIIDERAHEILKTLQE